MKEKKVFKIEEVEFDFDAISDASQKLVKAIIFADNRLNDIRKELVICDGVKDSYLNELKAELKNEDL